MLSFVIPARNEAASLAQLAREIADVCTWHDYAFEVVIVDDGSTDGTWAEIVRLAKLYPKIRGLRFRRNFGKGPAMSAGFSATTGDIVVVLDADLQDCPEDLPAFVEALKGRWDVVVGWRQARHDPLVKRLLSKLFNTTVGVATGLRLHDHNCGFKAFRRAVIADMRLYGDMHRYVPILAHTNGFRVGEIPVKHRSRAYGQSNYGLSRTYRGFFDLITVVFLKSFRHRPMHFLGTLGVLSLLAGFAGLAYLAGLWLTGQGIGGRPLLIYSAAATVFGSQVLATGILAELLTAYMARFENTYAVQATTETPTAPQPKRAVAVHPAPADHPPL